MIDLYTWGTPNGRKVSIMLEAIQAPYRVHSVNILEDEQFSEHFTQLSPNGKIPAILDSEGPDGKPYSLFESGAILIYLAEKSGQFLATDSAQKMQTLQWLMWQMGGFGPFLGQAHHFNHFLKEDVPYAKARYLKEAQRLWGVLDTQLSERQFVCDEMSIADFAIYPWSRRHAWQNVDTANFPNVARWMADMDSYDFVRRGMAVPDER
ncbi:MAG: glutathione S-transferase N-terminal domain-containing protein [Pseudomonadales bacterium]